ncbi:hypothetical protein P3W45_001144 [Vairimorpha bombi]
MEEKQVDLVVNTLLQEARKIEARITEESEEVSIKQVVGTFFEGYNGNSVAIFDEFYDNIFSLQTINQLHDGNLHVVPVKHNSKANLITLVFIISNLPREALYAANEHLQETWLRRINHQFSIKKTRKTTTITYEALSNVSEGRNKHFEYTFKLHFQTFEMSLFETSAYRFEIKAKADATNYRNVIDNVEIDMPGTLQ